jgi:hypothetical protein
MNRKKVYRVRIQNPQNDSNIELYFDGWSVDNIKSQVRTYMAMNRIPESRQFEVYEQ